MPTGSNPMPPPCPYTGGYIPPTLNRENNSQRPKKSKFPIARLASNLIDKIYNSCKKFILSPPIFAYILTFVAWFIIYGINEENAFAPIGNIISKPQLLTILLIPLLMHTATAVSTFTSDKKFPKPTINLKYPNEKDGKSQNSILQDLASKHISLIKSIFPIFIAAGFIIVLYHNRKVATGDLGLALQITSAQFPEQKYQWTAILITYLTIFYLSLLPAIILPQINRPKLNLEIHRYILLKSLNDNQIKPHIYYNYLAIQAAILTVASNITLLYVLKIAAPGSTAETFLLMVALSMVACTIPISHIVKGSMTNNDIPDKDKKHQRVASRIIAIILALVILIASWVFPKFILEHIPEGLGEIIANPGTTIETNEIDYACIFPNNTESKESITLGVVAESKPESIRIFTPEYNQNDNNYGKQMNEGKVKLNKLVETQIKISGSYRIEKFDNSKHWYNLNSGKCVYKNTSPFFVSSFPLEHNG